ncbi:DNA methyltransferase [Sinorhizobium meliloti]|nr:DNA methyltransferase [Sinorhizobium meliloti]
MTPFPSLGGKRYDVILSDPPWRFRTWNEENQQKSASKHYPLMTLDAIKALPVSDLAKPDCLMMMWAVQPMLDQALEVMSAWGFKYKTAGAWAKQSATGTKWAFGTGYLLRCSAEFFIVGTRGNPKSAVKNVRNLIVAPIREHSRKPDEMHLNLERMFPDADRLEMFSRESKPGWDVWGNQTGKFDAANDNVQAEVRACA